MKKIIVGLVASVFLLIGAGSVFASGPFNGQSGDCPGIAIGNYTTGVGIGGGQWNCWTRQSVTASAGDTINVALYYHNNTSSTLTNVGATLSQSSNGPTTNYSFSGNMSSDQGSTSLGTVSLTLNSSQTLTYSSAHWMKDKNAINSDTDSTMLYGQTGNVMKDGGLLRIGSVPPGWNDYGYIIVVFKIGTTPVPQLCLDPNASNYGGPLPCIPYSTFTITAIPREGGVITPGGVRTYNYNASATYSVDPLIGYKIVSVLIDGVSVGDVNPNSYHRTFTNIQKNYTIEGIFERIFVSSNCLATLSVSPSAINSGQSATLSWTISYCSNVTVYPIVGNVNVSGSQLVSPTDSTLYTLTGYSSNGGVVVKTAKLDVNRQQCLDRAANNYLSYALCTYDHVRCLDQSANNYLSYEQCTYTQQRCLDQAANNYLSYALCTYNQVRCLDQSANNYLSYAQCTYTQQRCLDTSANNYLSYALCTYNQVRCLDQAANNYLSYTQCTYTQQTCTDRAANNYGSYGSCTYTQTRCLDQAANNYLSYTNCTYTQTRCLDQAANNYLSYTNCTYTQTRCLDTTASNYLSYNTCTYNTVLNKSVVTTVATNITSNQAQINGYITNSSFYNSNVYFNYGTTVNLGSRTTSKTTTGSNSFSDFITGLNPNTIYYFQAVGETTTGTSKGWIEIFQTLGDGTVKPIVIQGTTIVGNASPVQLSITNKYELIGQGDLVDYTITYKNIGKTKLIKPMVQVILPSNFTLVNASRGTYSVDTHTLSALIEDLDKAQEGTIFMQAKVDSVPTNNAQIVTTAILVYTNSNGAQENAMAYALNIPKLIVTDKTDTSTQGANAFFAGLISIGLIGWLLIILVISVLVLIVNSVYSRNPNTINPHTPTH